MTITLPYSFKGKRVWVAGEQGMVGQALVHSVTRMVEDNEKLRTDISEKSLRLDELSRRARLSAATRHEHR